MLWDAFHTAAYTNKIMEPAASRACVADATGREEPLRFSTCETCGRQIDATARICPECGALTGVSRSARDEPVVSPLSFVTALVVGLVASLVLRWLGVLP